MGQDRLAIELLDAALADGGGTFDYNGNVADTGDVYVVGGVYPSLKLRLEGKVEAGSVQLVSAWIFNNRSSFYGSWLDEEGVCWIDAVDLVRDQVSAVVLGKERGEKAIWDGVNGQDLVLAKFNLGDGWVSEVEG